MLGILLGATFFAACNIVAGLPDYTFEEEDDDGSGGATAGTGTGPAGPGTTTSGPGATGPGSASASSSSGGGDCNTVTVQNTACTTCGRAQCCSQMAACAAGSACATYQTCVQGCLQLANMPAQLQACLSNCDATQPAGKTADNAMRDCLGASCSPACDISFPICNSGFSLGSKPCVDCLDTSCCSQYSECYLSDPCYFCLTDPAQAAQCDLTTLDEALDTCTAGCAACN